MILEVSAFGYVQFDLSVMRSFFFAKLFHIVHASCSYNSRFSSLCFAIALMSSDMHAQVNDHASAPFEGAEKLLEIWFAKSAGHVLPVHGQDGKLGLRAVPKQTWEDMLQIVKCKVLSDIQGTEMDAYLLRLVQPIRHIFSS